MVKTFIREITVCVQKTSITGEVWGTTIVHLRRKGKGYTRGLLSYTKRSMCPEVQWRRWSKCHRIIPEIHNFFVFSAMRS